MGSATDKKRLSGASSDKAQRRADQRTNKRIAKLKAEIEVAEARIAERREELAGLLLSRSRNGPGRPQAPDGSLVREILDVVDAAPKKLWRVEQVTEACVGSSHGSVRTTLNRLVRTGRLARGGRGVFRSLRGG